jgi:hypothetical protein
LLRAAAVFVVLRAVRVLDCVATDPSFLSRRTGRDGQGASTVL